MSHFFDDEDGFDSDSSSVSFLDDHEQIADNLGQRRTNKQIETLKYLKAVLRENKGLKRRLEMVEDELERYELNGDLPNNRQSMPTSQQILPIHDRAISVQSSKFDDQTMMTQSYREDSVVTSVLKSRDDKTSLIKQAQTVSETNGEEHTKLVEVRKELMIESSVMPVRVMATTPVMMSIQSARSSKVKVDKSFQTEDLFSDKVRIKELENYINQLKIDHEKEKLKLGRDEHETIDKIKRLTEKVESLTEKLASVEKSLEIANHQYAESEKNNMKLMEDIGEIRPLRQKYELLKIENDRLYGELRTRQVDVEDGNAKFLELTQSLNKTLAMLEDQKSVIGGLEAECEKQKREKHLTCKAQIEELTAECVLLREELVGKSRQVEVLTEAGREAEKQVERYKADMKNFNFKEFVSMKRELNSLKQERERYQASVVTMPSKSDTTILPPITKDAAKKNSFQFF